MSSTKFKQNLDVTGDINLSGNISIGGNTLTGDANTDSVTFNADVTSNIVPDADVTYDLGTSTKTWREVFTSKINSATGDDLDIHSGSDIALYPAGNIWIKAQTKLIFEGTVPDDFEAKLQATSITADRDIILPDASGTLALTSDLPNQSLNTTDDATFNSLTVSELTITGPGISSIESGNNLELIAANRVLVVGAPFKLANFTTAERDLIVAQAGDMIYNTTTNKFQGYTLDSDGIGTPGWIDLH